MNASRRCLTLRKGTERYVFWYATGQESELLASLLTLAGDPQATFDWFDAAVLSYQMGRHAERNNPDLALR